MNPLNQLLVGLCVLIPSISRYHMENRSKIYRFNDITFNHSVHHAWNSRSNDTIIHGMNRKLIR